MQKKKIRKDTQEYKGSTEEEGRGAEGKTMRINNRSRSESRKE